MSQIRYIASAALLLLLFAGGSFVFSKFYSVQWTSYILEPELGCGTVSPTYTSDTSAEFANGSRLFKTNCASCHSLIKNLSGPALIGVEERGPWTNRENLHKWIANPAKFIPTTQYTRDLQKTYGQVMPGFSYLTKTEVDEIFNWIATAQTPAP